MLSKFRKSEEGFTLIELLIVVAIIGILAAIAIPQFSAYRQRAYNGSAQSDVRNIKTAEESLLADAQTYGATEEADLASITGVLGVGGDLLVGPLGASTATVSGAALSGMTAQNRIVGIGISISNGVSIQANTDARVAGTPQATYILYAKHTQGTRAFTTEAENTGMFMVENPDWAGTAMELVATPKAVGTPTTAAQITSGTTDGGGSPTPAWNIM